MDDASRKSDEELVLGVQNGSEACFKLLYERYKKKIYNFVYNFLGNVAAAEDCTQDVFIRLYRKSSSYRPTAKFSSWLYQMARHMAIDALRKLKVRRAPSMEDPVGSGEAESVLGDFLSDKNPGPSQALLSDEAVERVRQAILKLKESDRQIILLCDIESLPHDEAAKILGYETSTLTVKLFRARQRLAEILKIDEQS